MNGPTNPSSSTKSVEDVLRAELAHGDVILATAQPILRHLLANDEHALFSDEVIAKVRGMTVSLARQLLLTLAETIGVIDRGAFADAKQDALAVELLKDGSVLGHAHALVLEAQLADRLQQRSGIDPVLSPLMQELAASPDAAIAGATMRVIAAQARFMQQVRRMDLPLSELPAELFHTVTQALESHETEHAEATAAVRQQSRHNYDEGERRIGQITRLLVAMDKSAKRALAVDHAGLAMFTTALAMAAEQERDIVVLSLGENQSARLALCLRSAGLDQSALEEQFLYLHPEMSLPEDFGSVPAGRAAELLESASLDIAV